MTGEPAELSWSPYAGPGSDEDHLGADLTGHFFAEAKRMPDGRWSFLVRDYQNNEMLSGLAESREGAQAAVVGWDRWVVSCGTDPQRGWPEE